ncbi:MAG: KEOPS complex subunit Pcc1 [Candidatus Heimdallarchaeota archaeon]
MPSEINIRIAFKSQEQLISVLQSLKVETSEKDIRRGSMDVWRADMDLVIRILADDLVAARSLSNSILRLLKTSTDVVDIISSDTPK